MPKYFLHLASFNAPTNALHQAAIEILKYNDRRLIDDKEAFIAGLGTRFQDENRRHSRCKPLSLTFTRHDPTRSAIYLGHRYTVGFYIYEVKE